MSKIKRIANVFLALLMALAGFALLFEPAEALIVVAFFLGLALTLYGVYMLVYYLTMARHMVGGLSVLFIAVIAIDLGSFALTMSDQPRLSIMMYLVGYNAFTGIVAIARAVESKLFESRWILTLAHGIFNLALAVACIVFVGSDQIIILIFCIGLFYNAGIRLIQAIKPTEIIYIQ